MRKCILLTLTMTMTTTRKIEDKLKNFKMNEISSLLSIEPKLDACLCDEKYFLMVKMSLVSKIHHEAKNIIR